MAIQNFNIKNGLSVNEIEIIDGLGNITLPLSSSIKVGNNTVYHEGNLQAAIEGLTVNADSIGGVSLTELTKKTELKTVNGISLIGTDGSAGDIDLSTNLVLNGTNLTYTNIDGVQQIIDLSGFLDDTTNTVQSAAITGTVGARQITFTREDSTTFTLDIEDLYNQSELDTKVNKAGDTMTGALNIASNVAIAEGLLANKLFRIYDSADTTLFEVAENGDVTIGGVINVLGDGTSYFAGDVSIAGSITVAESSTASADFSADNLTVTGNLIVQGNTTLGDEAGIDTTIINGVTNINGATTKALGNNIDDVFAIKDSDGVSLFDVKSNGDVNIAGVINVNGDGVSTFAGDVAIGGSITVADDATVTADFTADTLTITGNTILGDGVGTDTVTINGVTTLNGDVTKANAEAARPDLGIDGDYLNASNGDYHNLFEVKDSLGEQLFNVKSNGDVNLGGVINVYGNGDSYFAGNVNIAGSITVAESSTVTADFAANNLTVNGNLFVKGNTVLGDGAENDKVTVKSGVTKSAGSSTINVFEVVSNDDLALFEVKQNGDAIIGGSLTVSESATVTADMSSDNLTVTGNLVVNGNTTLGNEASDTINIIGVATAVTQDPADNSTKLATTEFVQNVAAAAGAAAVAEANSNILHGTATVTTTGDNLVDTFDVTTLKTGEFTVTVKDGTNAMTEKMVFQAGKDISPDNAYTSYASIGANLGEFELRINGNNAELYFVSTVSTGSITFKREFI